MGRMTSDTFQCRRILISTIRFPECCTNMDGLQGAVASSDVSCSIPSGTGVLKSKKAGWCHCTDGRNEKEASLVYYFTTQNLALVCVHHSSLQFVERVSGKSYYYYYSVYTYKHKHIRAHTLY